MVAIATNNYLESRADFVVELFAPNRIASFASARWITRLSPFLDLYPNESLQSFIFTCTIKPAMLRWNRLLS